ncbi:Asp23/Gls24 family envelope stress response protein [Anaerotignum lactatifermentans]|uniref:Asp23/Gls24 family envelope stress response protein n=1 Tax=Anaerotignum lactatifermentans TaxID=160404 RepID=A0ABS2G6K8_9FIRM|nr:Asp23/Gls24 family envelope stress response protein [Anaerotignum lactatifermentans]MBM6828080.1 Asp23/Gls24 family envelope stress response protein [Anaerotignum lactatifermentans]MBM6876757.1 Asp23/Gls24 family envelope stress response protein [Anaerotignum lactatifermentans]MBM6949663.1 Asp23/Gls24 family envelope stress response protein [Anaerotignum lactatifermentans]
MSEYKGNNGQIQIADEVISLIAVTAALEVEGVMEGYGGNKSFTEFFGKKGQTKCVRVTNENNEVVLDMEIIVKFGTKVQTAAEEVQKKVKNAVETMTGLNVPAVNVAVTGIVKEKAAAAEEE